LPKVVTQRCLEQDLNPRPTDRLRDNSDNNANNHNGLTYNVHSVGMGNLESQSQIINKSHDQ